jgi:lipoprotein NlpD
MSESFAGRRTRLKKNEEAEMIKSGCGKCGAVILGALLLTLGLAGCVKREPRVAANPQPETRSSAPEKKCGLICKVEGERKADADPLHEKDVSPSARNSQPERRPGLWGRLTHRGESQPASAAAPAPVPAAGEGKGVYHIVKKGETLYRICSAYHADVADVCSANHITDPASLTTGQRLWVPGADRTLDVPASASADSHNASLSPGTAPSQDQPPPSKGSLLFPVPNGQISERSRFGMRGNSMHEGVDILAPMSADIVAADDGKVVYSDKKVHGYGNMIIVKHSGNIVTVYAHNSQNLVKVGDIVKKGQKIAEVGQTGNATCTHCHFEVRVGEKPVNPEGYLAPKTDTSNAKRNPKPAATGHGGK